MWNFGQPLAIELSLINSLSKGSLLFLFRSPVIRVVVNLPTLILWEIYFNTILLQVPQCDRPSTYSDWTGSMGIISGPSKCSRLGGILDRKPDWIQDLVRDSRSGDLDSFRSCVKGLGTYGQSPLSVVTIEIYRQTGSRTRRRPVGQCAAPYGPNVHAYQRNPFRFSPRQFESQPPAYSYALGFTIWSFSFDLLPAI